jgi:serine/threonine protein kinase
MNEAPSASDGSQPLSAALRVDQACLRFEAAWREGGRPRIEDYLDDATGTEREALLRELIRLEAELRGRVGEQPTTEDYRARFPSADLEGRAPASTEPDQPRDAATPPAAAHGCELLEEIGHGGIGVVHRGRDRGLRRELAVKLLREKHRDNPDLRRRFVEEAQIGGQLQHPGVAPVYELGEFPDGRPYFTMKLIRGRTLADLLGQRKGPGEDLPRYVAIFEQVCQTLAYAHAHRVIHRDLKPANVMVGEFGEVQVMDWGMAKVLASRGHKPPEDAGADTPAGEKRTVVETLRGDATRDGAVMGTYGYMPPEQARGEVARLDERCDVFGLGAILCEILTGQPAYTGEPSEVGRKTEAGDLGDAYARLDGCGADPELARLARSCLAAEPEGRPRGAGAVATAVTEYRAGVQERLRQVEIANAEAKAKAAEERKRRRLRWSLAGSVLLTLLAGTSVSTYLAVLANDREGQVEKDAKTIKDERDNTAAALKESEANLTQSRIRLADGLLRPLGRDRGVLDSVEWKCIWELAALPKEEEPVPILFIDRALDKPETAEQLERRSAMAIHAAAGLDRKRREQILNLLGPRLRDREADGRIRLAAALAVAELTPPDEDYADLAAQAILDGMDRDPGPGGIQYYAKALGAVAPRMGAAAAATAAPRLLDVMAKETHTWERWALAEAFGAVAPRMDEAAAAAAAQKILDAMERDPDELLYFAKALGAVAPQMNAAAAAATGPRLLDAMAKETDQFRLQCLGEAWGAVASRMDAAAAAAAAETLLRAMDRNPDGILHFAKALRAVAPRMAAAAAVAPRLLDVMAKGYALRKLWALAEALGAVAPRMDAATAAAASQHLLDAMANVPAHLSPNGESAKAWAAVAPRLDTAGTAAAAKRLLDLMAVEPAPWALPALVEALGAVAPRMDEAAARTAVAAATRAILNAMAENDNPNEQVPLVEALGAVAPRMDEAAAAAAAETLLRAMDRNPGVILHYAKALPAVASRMDDAAAHKVTASAARTILDARAKGSERPSLLPLAESLGAVAPWMDAATAASAARAILDPLAESPYSLSPNAVSTLVRAWGAVASRMDEAGAAAVQQRLDAMAKENDYRDSLALAEAFGAVAPRMGEAAAACQRILEAIAKNPETYQRLFGAQLPWDDEHTSGCLEVLQVRVAKLNCQGKVNLLKHPACVGSARDVVLLEVGKQLNHTFADVWELVDWLAEHDPEVDVLSPPEQPRP